MLVGDEDEQLTEPELEIVFSECSDEDDGIKLLCSTRNSDYPDHIKLMEILTDNVGGIDFGNGSLEILIKDSDLKFGNWKKSKAVLK